MSNIPITQRRSAASPPDNHASGFGQRCRGKHHRRGAGCRGSQPLRAIPLETRNQAVERSGRDTSEVATRTRALTWANVVEMTTPVDLKGQLSNPDKPLKSLAPQGLQATRAARQSARARPKRPSATAAPRPSEETGHYSNPAVTSAGEQRERHDETLPPTAAHRTQRRLRAADVDSLVDGYETGATIAELATRFTINRTTVMAHLNRRNMQRRGAAKLWDDEVLAAAARSYTNGDSLAHIASQHAVDPQTVANRLRRAGVAIRPRPGSE